MSFLSVAPEAVAAAATELANIGSAVGEANVSAAAWTTELLPAAQDEVSAAVARVFGMAAQEFQTLGSQAVAFGDGLVQALNAAASAYLAAESSNVVALLETAGGDLLGASNTTAETQLGRTLVGSGPFNAMMVPSVDTTLVLGYTGEPIPSPSFVNTVNNLFIKPNFISNTLTTLFTPEQSYPFSGVKSLTTEVSVSQGVQILDGAIQNLIGSGTNSIGVFGYSQGATIASLEMGVLQAAHVPPSTVQFVLLGDPMNPNGGLFERFAGLQLPSLGMDFYGATPSNAYPTTIYSMEYDLFADFPRYPLNLVSDLNAILGTSHLEYQYLTSQQVAVQLPTSGETQTTYYMIPSDNLPLLGPVRSIPVIGNPIADLLQPDLTYVVNMGYGDPRYGWSTSPANVPTPFGLSPPLSSYEELPGLLVSGAGQGIQNFIGDFTGTGPNPVTLASPSSTPSLLTGSSGTGGTSALTNPLTALQALQADPAGALATAITDAANTISNSASSASGVVQLTTDMINAGAISIPAYDVSLFLSHLSNPIEAVGLPLAADTALYPLLAYWWLELVGA